MPRQSHGYATFQLNRAPTRLRTSFVPGLGRFHFKHESVPSLLRGWCFWWYSRQVDLPFLGICTQSCHLSGAGNQRW